MVTASPMRRRNKSKRWWNSEILLDRRLLRSPGGTSGAVQMVASSPGAVGGGAGFVALVEPVVAVQAFQNEFGQAGAQLGRAPCIGAGAGGQRGFQLAGFRGNLFR